MVVVGRGVTIGRSIGLLLTRREYNATVTLTHTGTVDLAHHLRQADVIVAAAGVKHIVRAEDVKPGAAVLDVGRDARDRPRDRQDARSTAMSHPDVAEVAGCLSPNPGGVGPMTVALLMTNVVEAAERAAAEPGLGGAWPSPGASSQPRFRRGERGAGAGGRRDRDESAVERDEGLGIQLAGARAVAVHGLDRRLELEAAERSPRARGPAQQRPPLGDELGVPQRGILLVERRPRAASRAPEPATART